MPNALPARLANLEFAGEDLQRSDLRIHLDIVSGLNDGLEVRGTDTVVPGLAGQVPRDRKANVRHIVLAGWIQGTGTTEVERQADYQSSCDLLEATFSLVADPDTLQGTARDGSSRSIEARPTNLVWDDEPAMGVCHITVMLDSVEPDWAGGSSS